MQGNNEKSQEMYSYILDNLDYDIDDNQSRIRHILKHLKDDKTKDFHGVFLMDPIKLLDNMDFNNVKKQIGYMSDVYCFHIEKCGYEGGVKGDGHTLDYVTVITFPNDKSRLITMFPSDQIDLSMNKNSVSYGEELLMGEKNIDNFEI